MLSGVHISLGLLLVLALGVSASAITTGDQPDETSAISNRIVFIRHAEKGFTPDQVVSGSGEAAHGSVTGEGNAGDRPPWGPPPGRGRKGPPRGPPPGRPGRGPPGRGPPPGKFPNGLSEKGKQRAQYIRTLFGNESEYDFGLIFAAPWNASLKATERTYATVAPLAGDLGLDVNIDCANAEPSCIVGEVRKFDKTSDKDILISWKHFYLNVIATELGAINARETYPDERNDVIWIMEGDRIVEKRSMHCPVLDDGRVDEGDPDLEVEEPRADTVGESFVRVVRSSYYEVLYWLGL